MGSFDRNLNRSQIYIGAKRGGEGRGGKKCTFNAPSFFPSSLFPTPLNACYVGYSVCQLVPLPVLYVRSLSPSS